MNKNNLSLVIENHTVALTPTNVELITSFLLDSTDEYLNYDHVDVAFSAERMDACFTIATEATDLTEKKGNSK